jgi:hypothetical protein
MGWFGTEGGEDNGEDDDDDEDDCSTSRVEEGTLGITINDDEEDDDV